MASLLKPDSHGNLVPVAPSGGKGVGLSMLGATSGYAGWMCPSVGPSVMWKMPTADAAGYLHSDGSLNTSFVATIPYSVLTGTPTIDTLLPSETGNSGKFLTTNGSAASWAAVSSPTSAAPTNPGVNLTGTTGATGHFMDAGTVLVLDQTIAPTMSGIWTFQPSADANKGIVVKGHSATQSGHLQDWQRSDGTVSLAVIGQADAVYNEGVYVPSTSQITFGSGSYALLPSSQAINVLAGGNVTWALGNGFFAGNRSRSCTIGWAPSSTLTSAALDVGWESPSVGLVALTNGQGNGTVFGTLKLGTLTVAQPVNNAASPTALTITGAANTSCVASTEATIGLFDGSAICQWATGALTTQEAWKFKGQTIAFVGASTVTNYSTLDINSAGTAGTNCSAILNNYFLTCGGAASPKLALSSLGSAAYYRAVPTAGWGVPAIYGSGYSAGNTAAVASVATYTVGAADGTFELGAYVGVSAVVTASVNVTATYTDEQNVSRTVTFSFVQNGVPTPIQTITNVTGTGSYAGSTLLNVRCKASTAITIATSGSFVSITYDVGGSIKQIG